jgi:hypothetical protein
MTEIFLLAVIIVGLKGVGIGRVEVSWGLHVFVAALLLAYLSSTWAWAALGRRPLPASGGSGGQRRQALEDVIEGGG